MVVVVYKDSSEPRVQWRRSTEPGRKNDPERTRRLILAAAKKEFSEHGYRGARMTRIATAAGVGRQSITYHFGDKEALYGSLYDTWVDISNDLSGGTTSLVQVLQEFVSWVHDDESWARTLAREGLDGGFPISDDRIARLIELVEKTRQRQKRGELSEEIDVGSITLAFLAACSAPVIYPAFARAFVGVDPSSTDFRDLYANQLALMLTSLAARSTQETPDDE